MDRRLGEDHEQGDLTTKQNCFLCAARCALSLRQQMRWMLIKAVNGTVLTMWGLMCSDCRTSPNGRGGCARHTTRLMRTARSLRSLLDTCACPFHRSQLLPSSLWTKPLDREWLTITTLHARPRAYSTAQRPHTT